MANVMYDPGRDAFLNGDIDYTNDTIRVYLVDTDDYAFSAAHQYLSSVAAGGELPMLLLLERLLLLELLMQRIQCCQVFLVMYLKLLFFVPGVVRIQVVR